MISDETSVNIDTSPSAQTVRGTAFNPVLGAVMGGAFSATPG